MVNYTFQATTVNQVKSKIEELETWLANPGYPPSQAIIDVTNKQLKRLRKKIKAMLA